MKNGSKLLIVALLVVCLTMGLTRMALAADEIPQVSMEELKQMIDDRKTGFLVIDVQPKDVYDTAHITGAVNLPWDYELKTSGNLPRDRKLIFYCDCPSEEDSRSMAAQLKRKFHYTNVAVLKGSWTQWRKQGYPVERK